MKKFIALAAPVVLGVAFGVTQVYAASDQSISVPTGFQLKTFAQGSAKQTQPDDITDLHGNIFVGYQNGISPTGGASPNHSTQSTIVEYTPNGIVMQSWQISGKCDGLTADPTNNRVIATVNEDGNSSMYLVTPGKAAAQHLKYSPDPAAKSTMGALATGGGTDSIVIVNRKYFLSASNPAQDAQGKFTHAALFAANIDTNTGVVTLQPALAGNASAKDAVSGANVTLNLSDPDSSTVVPQDSPKFAGDLMLDSQGDQELVFINHVGTQNQSQTRLKLSAQSDDVVWATSKRGTLYISESKANKVIAITGTFAPGTAFASVGSSVGTLNLSTGKIVPFVTGLSSSHGMVFVPSGSDSTGISATVAGATSPVTGIPLDNILIAGLGLIIVGSSLFIWFWRRSR